MVMRNLGTETALVEGAHTQEWPAHAGRSPSAPSPAPGPGTKRSSRSGPGRRTAPSVRLLLPTVLAVIVTVAWVVQPATAATPAKAQASYARSAANATNAERLAHDRSSLAGHRCLRAFAVRQAKAMAAKDEMYHQDLGPILAKCDMSRVGENVAYGYKSGTAAVEQGWMKSPPHRANLLAKRYTRVAIAARQADDGTWYAAQVFGRPA